MTVAASSTPASALAGLAAALDYACPTRTDLGETPRRMLDALVFACRGAELDPTAVFGLPLVAESTGIVTLRGIPVISTCEHHLLPFHGTAAVSFAPDGRLAGIGRIAALVDAFAGRLQLQERLTAQIADFLYSALQPRWLSVRIGCTHTCLFLAGVGATPTFETLEWRGTASPDHAN